MERTKIIDAVNRVGEEVLLKGWVNVRRNMGKLVFIDLRDRSGIMQVVMVPAEMGETAALMNDLRAEYVLAVRGVVQKRGAKQINANMPTGEVEVLCKHLEIINTSEVPPFEIDTETNQAKEEMRLEYRYLDLRHERMKNNMVMRSRVMNFVRNFMHGEDFVEIQTPILSKSTPEGARDYLVPSRVHKGKFFALPQAPQQYKQLLMVSGMEKYFQIAPCFRDEDARADRSPGEFYQVDIEMSFIKQEDILALAERLIKSLIKTLYPKKYFTFEEFPRLNYDDAMRDYGCDKPDLRKDKNDPDELAFCWVLNFPLFLRQNPDDFFHGAGKEWGPAHNMFTAPKESDVALLDSDIGSVKSYQHDFVLNGFEIAGGAIRIHDPKLQEKIFEIIGFTEKDKEQFSHLLRAFTFGVPPHGGMAFGFDRLFGLLQGEKNLREVIAFPLTSEVRDPLMGAPSMVAPSQLDELGIEIKKK